VDWNRSRHGDRIEHPWIDCLRDISWPHRSRAIPEEGGESMIKVLSVDDHPLLREGIAALVNAESDMKLIAEATNGQEAIEKFRQHRPDVTLMDLQMPALNGIEAIIGIRSEFPNARVIVLTTYAGDVQVVRPLKAGARVTS